MQVSYVNRHCPYDYDTGRRAAVYISRVSKRLGRQVFNFRRNEVRSFLLGAALFWAERYHVDGFRCDAVSSMIYRDFGKRDGEWIPNENGHVSNLEAVSLLQELNRVMREHWPGVVMIAEESTAWEGVTTLRREVGFRELCF